MLIQRNWTHCSARYFPARISALAEILVWLADWSRENSMPDEVLKDLRLVAEELFVNVVYYSGLPHGAYLGIKLACGGHSVGMEFVDAGKPWNPLEDSAVPQLGAETEDVLVGGLGVFLVRELTQEQAYRREYFNNRFCVVKDI